MAAVGTGKYFKKKKENQTKPATPPLTLARAGRVPHHGTRSTAHGRVRLDPCTNHANGDSLDLCNSQQTMHLTVGMPLVASGAKPSVRIPCHGRLVTGSVSSRVRRAPPGVPPPRPSTPANPFAT